MTEEARHAGPAGRPMQGSPAELSRGPRSRPGTCSLLYGLLSCGATWAPTRHYQRVPGWPCTGAPLVQAEFAGAVCKHEHADLGTLRRSEAKRVPSLRTTCTYSPEQCPRSGPASSYLPLARPLQQSCLPRGAQCSWTCDHISPSSLLHTVHVPSQGWATSLAREASLI